MTATPKTLQTIPARTITKATSTPTSPTAALIGELEALLHEERCAVAAFDVATIERLAVRKDAARAELAAACARGVDPSERAAATRLAAFAEANAALLGSSIEAIADILGLRVSSGTYDSRARLRQRIRAAGARLA